MRAFLTFTVLVSLSLAARQKRVRFEVKEEEDAGTIVGDVSKTEIPTRLRRGGFGKIRYTFQDPTQTTFVVDENTGILTTNIVLDRENLPSAAQGDIFQIQITISTGSMPINGVLPTEVKIMDINDNSPRFPQDIEILRISESAPENSRFTLQRAIDPDIGNNSIQSYRIVTGNEDGVFGLRLKRFSADSIFVFLVNVKRLDREKKDFYHLVIAALDGGTPLPRAGRKELNITILDSNDHSPEFSTDFYKGKVQENAPNGTFILRVQAVDKDIGTNGEIKFSLDPHKDRDLFRLDERTGEIWTNAVLDYETKEEYRLTLTAQDQGPDSIPSKAQITIKVIDQNDNAPTITVKLVKVPNAKTPGHIPEDVGVGRNVAIIEIRDKDSQDSVNSQVDVDLFQHKHDFALKNIFRTLYNLVVQRPLNLTRNSRYEIKFTARDRGKPAREANFTLILRIDDKNRNAPKFKETFYDLSVMDDSKPGSLISTITGVDPDTDREGDLAYSIKSLHLGKNNVTVSNPERFFSYGKKTGEMKIMQKLWCAFTASFHLVLEVRDNGRSPLRGEAVMRIAVQCAKYQYNFSIPENKPKGYTVGHIAVNTRSPGESLSFSLTSSGQQDFTINNATGLIKTTHPLDREKTASYALHVFVSDGIVSMHLTTLVRVVDENDNAPIFIALNDNHEVSIPSDAKRGDEVLTIRATDPDEGSNGKIHYSLIEGNEDKTFILDKDRGELVVFNYMFKSSYTLTIRAVDMGDNAQYSLIRIRVLVVPPAHLVTTTSPSDSPMYDSRGSEGGFLESKTMLIVVAVCSSVGLLVIVGVVFLVIRYRRQSGKSNHRRPSQPTLPRESYTEPEISREAAIQTSKKMYSQATVNMYNSNEMLDSYRGKNSQAQPLQTKGSLPSSPPSSTNSLHRHHGLPRYGEIYPPVSTTRPVSEGFSSGDEIDSGRGDSSRASSPYSSHTAGRRYHEQIPAQYDSQRGHHTMNHNHYPARHHNGSHYKYPVVTLPTRTDKKKSFVTMNPTGPSHSATDL